MKILGVDPSLTSTGEAVIWSGKNRPPAIATRRIESAPPKRARGDKRPATLPERAARIRAIASDATSAFAPDLAVVEAPSYGSQGASTWDRAWLWGNIVHRLLDSGVPVAIVPPATRALWATGSGKAGKSPIAVHMSRMWPDLDPDSVSDDEWDAVALASIGAQKLGVLPVELQRHRDQLAKITWPGADASGVQP